MAQDQPPQAHGRGSSINPESRFGLPVHVPELEHVEFDEEHLAKLRHPKTEYYRDSSRTVVTENNSPDIPFRFSINPYRGCLHGCSYCYARPYHEYLDLNAGLDFETKIFVKEDAVSLFRAFLCRPAWRSEPIMLSGVTDCYQPAERHFNLTRGCLEVALEARQPLTLITKNALIERDVDLLSALAWQRLVHVAISITTLDEKLARDMEPRTSAPAARLRAIKTLAAAGVPTRVMIAPIIPGLNESEVPTILAAAREAGAAAARYIMLRLPYSVLPVFTDWLERVRPLKKDRVLDRIREIRGGQLNDPRFGTRMRGVGTMADQIAQMFSLFAKRYQLDGDLPPYNCGDFTRPRDSAGQMYFF